MKGKIISEFIENIFHSYVNTVRSKQATVKYLNNGNDMAPKCTYIKR